MDDFTEELYRACQKAIRITNPPGIEKHNFAWDGPWFAWEITLIPRGRRLELAKHGITETAAFVFPKKEENLPPFYKLEVYLTAKHTQRHIQAFTFDIKTEEDLIALNKPLASILQKWKGRGKCGKAISALHEQVITAVLEPVAHEDVHTDTGSWEEEAIVKDEKTISSLKERPLISKMKENITNSEHSEEKIPYWKTIDPERPKNETERRAFEIVDEVCRDPEYAKVSKR
jgi:hypothetical protein